MRKIFLVLFMGLCAGLGQADELTRRVGLGIDGGVGIPVGAELVPNHTLAIPAWGFWARTGINDHWGAGFSYENLRFKEDHDYLQPMMVNAFYQLLPKSRWNPNVHTGLGITYVDLPDRDHSANFGVKLGVGTDFFANKHISVGSNLDYYVTAKNANTDRAAHVFALTLAVGFWGGPAEKCAAACSPVVTEAMAVPTPIAVGNVSVLQDDHFDFNQATLKPDAQKMLDLNIQILRENPKTFVRISGYTSAVGSPEYNQKLSERRADAVRDYLLKAGIAPERLQAVGYGEKNPVAHEPNPEDINSPAAKANRRTLFEIVVK